MKKLYCKIFGGTWQEGECTYWIPGFFENKRQDIKWFLKEMYSLKSYLLKYGG